MRVIHTIDGGSCPLPVPYVFSASASDYSWWSIIDGFCTWTIMNQSLFLLQGGPKYKYKSLHCSHSHDLYLYLEAFICYCESVLSCPCIQPSILLSTWCPGLVYSVHTCNTMCVCFSLFLCCAYVSTLI